MIPLLRDTETFAKYEVPWIVNVEHLTLHLSFHWRIVDHNIVDVLDIQTDKRLTMCCCTQQGVCCCYWLSEYLLRKEVKRQEDAPFLF